MKGIAHMRTDSDSARVSRGAVSIKGRMAALRAAVIRVGGKVFL
jgi:hypothetical protein